MNFVSYVCLRSQGHPSAVAVRSGSESWTYGELLDDVRTAANVLADHGVEDGSRVGLMLHNRYEFVVGTLATLARRAIVVPINPDYKRHELGHILGQSTPEVVLGTASAYEHAADELPVGTDWFDVGDRNSDRTGFWDAMATAADEYRIPKTLDSKRAFLLYTSGTTGQPKGVVHTHDNFIAVSDACAISYEVTPGDGFLAAMPMYHCTGMSVLGTTLKYGGELVLVSEWDPERTLRAIDEYDVNVFSGVPTMYQDWLNVDDGIDTGSMHTAVIGGAGTTAELIRRSEALLDCPVLNGYGMTESFIAGIWERRNDERRLPSVGRTTDRLVEVRVVDPDSGDDQPPGEPGELLIRGRPMMEEYFDEPEKTAAAFDDDGWFHTGDWARIDADDYLYIVDRMDYTILCGGHNVYPQEIEGVIESLDGVDSAVVVGREDDRKGAKPIALVTDNGDPPSADEIKTYCLENLAPYKHPREVQFVDELPRNDVGKVDRDASANLLPSSRS
ncbi:class I adenylate-forming enzyme family protein [Halosolutus amylolyticus]|uniref:Class I adenylate-forming enzyme family protein n=1 Tax=Halosolutus amylolyticus TaxID=2932267 RepID=A0ABD5PJ49_9EURY|nr:class I adenylate-forming enzyme family protein [Halosolutus amylolyticus]